MSDKETNRLSYKNCGPKRRAVYALYKGEENVMEGTLDKIAEHEGITIETAKHLASGAYRKRVETRKTSRGKGYKIIVRIGDIDDLECE